MKIPCHITTYLSHNSAIGYIINKVHYMELERKIFTYSVIKMASTILTA